MLLAVEGGGFFSSSASGYSKGLTLLLLGQKDEDDKPMRVSPWNQYHLVDQEPEVHFRLLSRRKWFSRAWVSSICFCCASGGDASPHPEVGGAYQQEIWPGPLVSDECNDLKADPVDVNGAKRSGCQSNLKRRSNSFAASVSDAHERESLVESVSNIPGQIGGRRVQWTDALGTELVEIREFEPSEIGESHSTSIAMHPLVSHSCSSELWKRFSGLALPRESGHFIILDCLFNLFIPAEVFSVCT